MSPGIMVGCIARSTGWQTMARPVVGPSLNSHLQPTEVHVAVAKSSELSINDELDIVELFSTSCIVEALSIQVNFFALCNELCLRNRNAPYISTKMKYKRSSKGTVSRVFPSKEQS